jgi:DNA polymerase I
MLIFCDIETEGLESTFDKSCKITRVGVAVDDEPAKSYDYTNQEESDDVWQYIHGMIDRGDTFVFHNAAFDVTTLRLNGYNIVNYHDTMCMSYVINPAPMQNHSLGNLAQLAGGEKTHFDFSTTKSEDDEDYDEWAQDLSEYNINDVEITRKVFDYLSAEMDKESTLWDYYFDVELPYIERIIEMLSNGVLMDLPTLQRMLSALTIDQTEMVKELEIAGGVMEGKEVIYSRKMLFATKPKLQFVGYNRRGDSTTYDHCEVSPFNPNSGSQIERVLLKDGFTDFPVYTKAGAPSFGREALEQIPHPLARKIIALKDLQAVLKFVPPLMEVNSDGRLRTSFKQFNTVTGRLSSASPNLQNMPAQKKAGGVYSYRADDAYNIRKCFIAQEGYQLVVGDLNRIELVVLAFYLEWVLEFSTMADAVRAGEDLHQSNADLWGCERRVAKTVIFCLVYGGGANKIAHITGISVKEAKQVIARIYATTPIEELKAELIAHARKSRGYFTDVLGRRLSVPAIVFDKKGQEYARAERQCFNYLIQGGAASIFKVLQNNAAERYVKDMARVRMTSTYGIDSARQLLQVHDEVVYEVIDRDAEDACKVLTALYTNDTILSRNGKAVPITCEFQFAANWYDAKEKKA